jgi:hypothetical protein
MKEDNEELSPELKRYLRRYLKRTGIFRMYLMDREFKRRRLLLEFVIRGHILFTIKLWSQHSPMWD